MAEGLKVGESDALVKDGERRERVAAGARKGSVLAAEDRELMDDGIWYKAGGTVQGLAFGEHMALMDGVEDAELTGSTSSAADSVDDAELDVAEEIDFFMAAVRCAGNAFKTFSCTEGRGLVAVARFNTKDLTISWTSVFVDLRGSFFKAFHLPDI